MITSLFIIFILLIINVLSLGTNIKELEDEKRI